MDSCCDRVQDEDVFSKLLSNEENDSSEFGVKPRPFKGDFCDLLLDAMDEELKKLQVFHPRSRIVSRNQSTNSTGYCSQVLSITALDDLSTNQRAPTTYREDEPGLASAWMFPGGQCNKRIHSSDYPLLNHEINDEEVKNQQRELSRPLEASKKTSSDWRKPENVYKTQPNHTPDQEHTSEAKESERVQSLREELKKQKQLHEELEQQLREECRGLYRLLEENGVHQESGELPPRCTVTEALANLRTFRQQLNLFIHHLQEVHLQKEACKELKKDQKNKLGFQRQQLIAEKDRAVNCLRKHLVEEKLEELCSLCDGGAVASLRRQLRAKELEIRRIQRNMSEWKKLTVTRVACEFEEALVGELERCRARLLDDGSAVRPSSSCRNHECKH